MYQLPKERDNLTALRLRLHCVFITEEGRREDWHRLSGSCNVSFREAGPRWLMSKLFSSIQMQMNLEPQATQLLFTRLQSRVTHSHGWTLSHKRKGRPHSRHQPSTVDRALRPSGTPSPPPPLETLAAVHLLCAP